MKIEKQFVVTLSLFTGFGASTAFGQAAAPADAAAAPASAASAVPAKPKTGADLPSQQVVVNGIQRGQLILPTTVTASSAYGIDMEILDTPRNNTILSTAQLDALNVKDPQGFSYLTSSSYSDSSFGVPNVPRIRGQFADVFVNGMRDSFTANGYGAPFSFNAIDTIDITKGPATVQAGPGAGVGGAINISTKQPNFVKFAGVAGVEFDTIGHRRLSLDAGGPMNDDVAWRFSYSGDNSGSYWKDQYFHQQSAYGVVTDRISPRYNVTLSGEVSEAKLTENDGVNRVNQAFIDHGTYLTGGIVGDWQPFGTQTELGNPVQLGRRVNIDEAPNTGARSLKYNLQLIQSYDIDEKTSISNNTFFNYLNRYNLVEDYFADSTKGSFTIENKTDLKLSFGAPVADLAHPGQQVASQSIDAGITLRYAHVEDIQHFLDETVSVFDLSGAPSSWVYPNAIQTGVAYTGAFNKSLYGIPARDAFAANASIDSNLTDIALFLEHRIAVAPTFNVLYGLRADFVHLFEKDPLGIDGLEDPVVTTAASHSTKWYMLANGNVSGVYRAAPWVSTYLTYNYAQYVDPTSDDGGVGTFGVRDSSQLRQATKLTELGAKFDLFNKSLFLSTAAFKQERSIPTGAGGTTSSTAHISGFEAEMNYQPNARFFMTASYSFLRTVLDSAAGFYDYPAQTGTNIDGAASEIVWATGQKFKDPGVPQNLFNLLANYKFETGLGLQGNLQVTSPIETTTSGQIDLASTPNVPASIVANGGYYKSPVIPRQYTLNTAVFYDYRQFEIKASVYNVTNRRNLTNDAPFYGNDFITVNPPRSLEVSLKARF